MVSLLKTVAQRKNIFWILRSFSKILSKSKTSNSFEYLEKAFIKIQGQNLHHRYT